MLMRAMRFVHVCAEPSSTTRLLESTTPGSAYLAMMITNVNAAVRCKLGTISLRSAVYCKHTIGIPALCENSFGF